MTWLLPLLVMIGSYVTIIFLIVRRSQQYKNMSEDNKTESGTTSGQGVIGRAKIQTVKVTGVLVLGFVLCWTPYNVMSLW